MHDIGKNIVGVVLAVQQLRGDRSRRHGAGGENPGDRARREGRHHRPVRADHALARRDVPRGGRDGAAGLRTAAADRRRHHQPRAYGGEDPSELQTRPGGLCERRQPRGRRGAGADVGARPRADYVAELRGEYAKIAAAHARAQADKVRLPLAAARGNAAKLDWSGAYVPPKPTFLGSQDAGRLSDRGTGRLSSTGRRSFQTWELRGKFPAILDDAKFGPGGALAVRRRARHAGQDRRRALVHGERGVRLLAGQCRRRRYSRLCRRGARQRRSRRCTRCASSCPSARAASTWRSAISWRRAPAGSPITSAPSRSPPASARTRSPNASSAPTTIIPPSWSRRWPTGWRKLLPNGCTAACAGNSGAMRRTKRLSAEDLIAEKYRGIRPAPGYPAQPDHTEKGTLFRLLEAERIGVKLTESFAMWPGAAVSGLYFSHPQSALFRRRQDRARPGRGLRQAQRLERGRSGAMAGADPQLRAAPRPASWRRRSQNKTPESFALRCLLLRPVSHRQFLVWRRRRPLELRMPPARSRQRKRTRRTRRAHSVSRQGPRQVPPLLRWSAD